MVKNLSMNGENIFHWGKWNELIMEILPIPQNVWSKDPEEIYF